MDIFYISLANFNNFLQSLIKDSAAYGLVPDNDGKHLHWEKIPFEKASDMTINKYRGVQPLKNFVFPAKEEVTGDTGDTKFIVAGAKQCDIAHLATLDSMFIGGALIDPYYGLKRQSMIIISGDCDACAPSCFCTLMGGKPYPEKGFDINLSPVASGFIAECGSETGKTLISHRKHLFEEPRKDHLDERNKLRSKMLESVNANNKDFDWKDPKDIVENNSGSIVWTEGIAKTCVECDACRFVCGTCYCFLLGETKKLWEKLRTWDSCQSTGYWRVAGGGNPHKNRFERLRNWYMCKLSLRPKNFGFYACTGCGRCVDVCQGNIDIRRSLQRLKDNDSSALKEKVKL
ncbi:MAG: 4Fe-4S dicluster domain-containing protein [Elusimicrobiota bacterium]